jgi:hypothetical protein
MDMVYIDKYRYEIQEQKEVPVWYTDPFRALFKNVTHDAAVQWLALLLRIWEVPRSTSFYILSNPLFINHLITERYIIRVTNSVVSQGSPTFFFSSGHE